MSKPFTLLFKSFSLLFVFLLVIFPLFVPKTRAADTATVTATVTAQNISVTVSDGTVTYGTLALSTNADTTSSGLNDSQTAQNNGNITEDLNIKGQNSGSWTLAGSVSADQYTHKWCVSNCDAAPTWNVLTTNYQTLASDVSASGTQVFDLQIGTPSSSSSYNSQSVDITVQAVSAS